MVAYDRLHNRETEAGAMLLAGVVGRENARALFGSEASAGIGDLYSDAIRLSVRAQGDHSTVWHGIHGVENEVGEDAMQQVGIGVDLRKRIVEFEARIDLRLPWRSELRFMQG